MDPNTNLPTLPTAGELSQAVELYLRCAYASAAIPPPVAARILPIRDAPPGECVRPVWFETSVKNGRTIYQLRLGQPNYPHMKLNLEPAPDGSAYLYMADAHDTHLHPGPQAAEQPALAKLRADNARLTAEIERAWVQAGLPTFRGWLRQTLTRRQKDEGPGMRDEAGAR